MKKNLNVLSHLIKRSVKIFLKDKVGVFFSLLAPLIILFLYVMFLGDIQINSIEKALEGITIFDTKLLQSFVDGWMLAGVVAVACLTVSFSAQVIMVKDKEDGVLADTLSSPIKRNILTAGYIISNYLITVFICLFVVIVAFIFLAISGWYLTFVQALGIIGMVFLSAISSCLISTLICKCLKSSNSHGAFVGIISAVIGFLIGAYMPISMFPKAIQYFTLFIPGTYSASIFRNLFMQGTLDKIYELSPIVANSLKKEFVLTVDLFGMDLNMGGQAVVLLSTIVLVVGLFYFTKLFNRKNNVNRALPFYNKKR